MSTSIPAASPEASARRVWWRLLLRRLSQVALSLPRDLRGVIQFEIGVPGAEPDCFYLALDGSKFAAEEGRAEACTTRVVSSEAKMADLLFAPTPPPLALRVHGDFSFYQRVMGHLDQAPTAKNWLEARSRRS